MNRVILAPVFMSQVNMTYVKMGEIEAWLIMSQGSLRAGSLWYRLK